MSGSVVDSWMYTVRLSAVADGAMHWSTRTMARGQGVSEKTIRNIWPSAWVAAASRHAVQPIEGSALCRQTPGCRGAVPQPNGQRKGNAPPVRQRPATLANAGCLTHNWTGPEDQRKLVGRDHHGDRTIVSEAPSRCRPRACGRTAHPRDFPLVSRHRTAPHGPASVRAVVLS